MVFEDLRVRPQSRAVSAWANAVVDALEQIYWISKRGDPDTPFEELYAYYGYFSDNIFVQGKQVLKDGDPINIYDIFEPAQQKITQAIDQSTTAQNVSAIAQYSQNLGKLVSIEQYVRDVRDRVVQLKIDQYGNVGVVIAQPLDEYGRLPVAPKDPDEDLLVVTRIINTSVETSPLILITPPSGKSIDVRRAYISTDSTSGKIYIKFRNSGKVITSIYPTKYGFSILPAIRIVGDPDEGVVVEWSNLSSGSEITVVMNYKLIP